MSEFDISNPDAKVPEFDENVELTDEVGDEEEPESEGEAEDQS